MTSLKELTHPITHTQPLLLSSPHPTTYSPLASCQICLQSTSVPCPCSQSQESITSMTSLEEFTHPITHSQPLLLSPPHPTTYSPLASCQICLQSTSVPCPCSQSQESIASTTSLKESTQHITTYSPLASCKICLQSTSVPCPCSQSQESITSIASLIESMQPITQLAMSAYPYLSNSQTSVSFPDDCCVSPLLQYLYNMVTRRSELPSLILKLCHTDPHSDDTSTAYHLSSEIATDFMPSRNHISLGISNTEYVYQTECHERICLLYGLSQPCIDPTAYIYLTNCSFWNFRLLHGTILAHDLFVDCEDIDHAFFACHFNNSYIFHRKGITNYLRLLNWISNINLLFTLGQRNTLDMDQTLELSYNTYLSMYGSQLYIRDIFGMDFELLHECYEYTLKSCIVDLLKQYDSPINFIEYIILLTSIKICIFDYFHSLPYMLYPFNPDEYHIAVNPSLIDDDSSIGVLLFKSEGEKCHPNRLVISAAPISPITVYHDPTLTPINLFHMEAEAAHFSLS